MGVMTAVSYPIAANAEAALAKPLGAAMREREARAAAGRDVEFVSEEVGPAFRSADEAETAYAEAIEAGTVRVREVVVRDKGRAPLITPVKPVYAGGRRWPKAETPAFTTAWRASVSYWRPVDPARYAELEQARRARKRAREAPLDRGALRALASQPLQPVKPQQPLDVGLFEYRLPEAPDIVIPDE